MKMRIGMSLAAALAVLAGGGLPARPLACGLSDWLSDPVSVLSLRPDAKAGTLAPDVAGLVLNAHPQSTSIRFSAKVRPQPVRPVGKGWATAGLVLAADERNFWQLVFVTPPDDSGLQPFCELETMRDGRWNASGRDGLRRTRYEQHGSWRSNETYSVRLELADGQVSGTVTESSGRLLYAAAYALDGKPAVRQGRPAVRTSRELTAVFSALDCTSDGDVPDMPDVRTFPPYRPVEPASSYRSRATGFFRVEKDADGLWWAVDPHGRGLYLSGVDHVRWDIFYCEKTMKNRHYEVNRAKYGTKAAWEASALERLGAWGFNTLGCGCDPDLRYRGLVHTTYLNLGGRLAHADERLAIRYNPHMNPCEGFPNVFDPLWPELCDYVARQECARTRDDPWLLGYFIDNELTWWGKVWDNDGATGLFDLTLSLPPGHTARRALVDFLAKRGLEPSAKVSVAVKTDFLRLAAERYFSVATAAIRRADPNHLVLGCRFATLGGAHAAVWEVAGKYCDVVTCNIYPQADLAHGVVYADEKKDAPTLADAVRARCALARRPMMVTEWSFPALDAGLPCKRGAGQRLKTQAERTRATELCARTFLTAGCVVGSDYFMWVDEPAEGISEAFPEDSNYGLLSAEDVPYPIAEMFAGLHRKVDVLRRSAAEDPVDCVDPFVGCAWTGHAFPGPTRPFGLVQPGPDSGTGDWQHCSGYVWDDPAIYGFSQTHLSGTGCPELADVRLLPFTGPVPADCELKGLKDRASERAEIGYYAVSLTNFGVRAEVTCGRRMAFHRWKPERGGRLEVLVDPQWACATEADIPGHLLDWQGGEQPDGRTLVGGYRHRAWLAREVHYKLRFDRPWAARRTLPPRTGDKAPRTVYSFDLAPGETLGARIAIATTDDDGAARNFAAEDGLSFDTARVETRRAWAEMLSRARIGAADRAQRTTFYTSLYHLFLQPNDIADADGRYRGADGKVHVAKGGRYFSGLSLWDTYRAAHPLYTLLAPEIVSPVVESMLEQYRQVGFLPVIPYFGRESYCMIGNHAVPVVVDAWRKGFRDYDAALAFEAVTNALTVTHRTPEGKPKPKEDWDVLGRYGYYPYDLIRGEGVSRTLECAYDDWCAAEFARLLGKAESERFFRTRSRNWTNVLDRTCGLVRGKDSRGRWREPFDPYRFGGGGEWKPYDCTEGNAWQWTWHVFQEPEALIAAFGGNAAFVRRLDAVFRQPEDLVGAAQVNDTTGLIGQYVHGNEPSHHIAYFYPFAGRPDRTAEVVREVCDRFYLPRPDGLCGNDDCGQMSAWYVFACLGFYPFDPCSGDYVLGAPQAAEVSLRLPNGRTLRTVAKGLSRANRYVGGVTFGGRPVHGIKLSHPDLLAGGDLVFEMQGEAN